ncbi:MAG: cobalamin-binding protein [Chloroflexota bacterium]
MSQKIIHPILSRKGLALLLAAVLLLSACAQSAPVPPTATPPPTPSPIVLADGSGQTITLSSPAQRIVSLAPSNTEMLFAIGAGSQVIGRDAFSDYPAEAQSLPDIGGSFGELNTEVLVSLKPDLVLAADLTAPEQVQAIKDLGLTVFVLSNPTSFDGLFANLQTVARLTGRETQAEALVKSLQGRLEAVQQKVAPLASRPLVFYELDATEPNAPWTSGPGTFIDTLITLAGGENLGASLEGAWAQISLEVLLTRDPQIIILGDYTWGGVTPEALKARPGWEALSAAQNGRVYTIDDNLVSRPGPRLVDGLEAMAKLLHPDIFQ